MAERDVRLSKNDLWIINHFHNTRPRFQSIRDLKNEEEETYETP